jgi:hypothetical protein
MTDQMITCPRCGCDGCYKTPINETKHNYFCWGCGFQTNDLMKEGEFDFEQYEEAMPELYKDLKNTDSEGRVWYPITINLENKGTVFVNGKSRQEAQWCGIKVVELTEEEKKQPKYKDKTHKSDPKSLKYFGSDFIEACDYVGMFDK